MDIKNNFNKLDKIIFFILTIFLSLVFTLSINFGWKDYFIFLIASLVLLLCFAIIHVVRSEFILLQTKIERLYKTIILLKSDLGSIKNEAHKSKEAIKSRLDLKFDELNAKINKRLNQQNIISYDNKVNSKLTIKKKLNTDFDYNSFFDKIYIINLKRRKDRKKQMINKLKKVNLNYEFFQAVDGRKYQQKFNDLFKDRQYWGKVNSPGAIGLLATYHNILKETLKHSNINNILLLEDDIYFHKKFNQLIKKTSKVFQSYDVVYLGANQERFSEEQMQQMESNDLHGYEISKDKHYITYGTFGIFLSKRFLKVLFPKIKKLTKESITIDVEIFRILADSEFFKGFVLYPNLVIPETRESDNMGSRDLEKMAITRKWNLDNYQILTENRYVFIISSFNNEKNYKRNLDSVYQQEYKNYRVIYIDDCSEDSTYDLVNNYKKANTLLIRNHYDYGPAYSRYIGYMMCEDDEIVVLLDGDDYLYNSKVLTILNEYYNQEYDLTYGSFRLLNRKYNCIAEDYPSEVISNKAYRQYELPPSHLWTTYAKNLKKNCALNLFDEFGNFIQVSTDYLDIMHALENSVRPKAIPQLLLWYNDKNSENFTTSWFKKEINGKYRDYINNEVFNKNRFVEYKRIFNPKEKTVIIPIELYYTDRMLFNFLVKKAVYENLLCNILITDPKNITQYNLVEYERWDTCELENKITYIIPNYNNEKFIQECLESLFNQKFQDFYIIICDDASVDSSREIIDQIKDERITRLYNKSNIGVGPTTEVMLKHSKTVWNAILDGDDAITPNNSFELKLAIEKTDWRKTSMIYSNFYYCDSELNITSRGFSRELPKGKTALEANCVSHMRVINKYFFYQTTGYEKELRLAVDKDMVFKLEELGKLHFINEQLYLYRKNQSSLTHNYDSLKYFEMAKENAYKRRENRKIVNQFINTPKTLISNEQKVD